MTVWDLRGCWKEILSELIGVNIKQKRNGRIEAFSRDATHTTESNSLNYPLVFIADIGSKDRFRGTIYLVDSSSPFVATIKNQGFSFGFSYNADGGGPTPGGETLEFIRCK